MLPSDNVIVIAIFSSVTLAAYLVFALLDPYRRRVQTRVLTLQQEGRIETLLDEAPPKSLKSDVLGFALIRRFELFRHSDRRRLYQRFAKAGIYDSGAMNCYFIAKLCLATIPSLLAFVTVSMGYCRIDAALLGACVAGSCGSLMPALWLERAIARHHISLQRSLPDFLDLMIVCLDGGLSIQETIRRVGDELRLAHPALALELGIMRRDVELGSTVEQSLKRFADRTDYEGVRSLSAFIRETQRFGTNVTEALRTHAEMLRLQREESAEEHAQKAAVKILIPTLLLIFPAIFVVLVGPAIIQIQEAFSGK